MASCPCNSVTCSCRRLRNISLCASNSVFVLTSSSLYWGKRRRRYGHSYANTFKLVLTTLACECRPWTYFTILWPTPPIQWKENSFHASGLQIRTLDNRKGVQLAKQLDSTVVATSKQVSSSMHIPHSLMCSLAGHCTTNSGTHSVHARSWHIPVHSSLHLLHCMHACTALLESLHETTAEWAPCNSPVHTCLGTHTHTHTHMHARTHAHTCLHAHRHVHTQSQSYLFLIGSKLWLRFSLCRWTSSHYTWSNSNVIHRHCYCLTCKQMPWEETSYSWTHQFCHERLPLRLHHCPLLLLYS